MGSKTEIRIGNYVGVICTDKLNKNGRIYPKEVMEKAIKEYVERIKATKEYKLKLRQKKLKRIIWKQE